MLTIGFTEKGTKVIRIKQGKVSQKVVIPIINEELENLLEKYDYTAPKLNEQVINRYIKEICQDLSQTMSSLGVKYRTLLTKTEQKGLTEGRMRFEQDESGSYIKPK